MPSDVRSAVGNSPELRDAARSPVPGLTMRKRLRLKTQTSVGVAQCTTGHCADKVVATVGRYSPGVVASSG